MMLTKSREVFKMGEQTGVCDFCKKDIKVSQIFAATGYVHGPRYKYCCETCFFNDFIIYLELQLVGNMDERYQFLIRDTMKTLQALIWTYNSQKKR